MTASHSSAPSDRAKDTTRRALTTVGVVAFIATTVCVTIVPVLLDRLFSSEADYSRISDIGQSYGAASAMISTLALGAVMVSLIMQYRQSVDKRRQTQSDMNEDLVRLAMDEPLYRQCWGARTSPDDVDEALFYYCNRVLKLWKLGWDSDDQTEAQTRGYLRNFFDSEIPRLFWEMHGDWHRQAPPRNRRQRFLALVNEEYLRAIHSGPPARSRERGQPAIGRAKSRRQQILDADQVNGRPIVP